MSYTQLTENERYQIYALKKSGDIQAEIAGQINRHQFAIQRELCRHAG